MNEIRELCRELKPLMGEKIEDIYNYYLLCDDNDEKKEIERYLEFLHHTQLEKKFGQPMEVILKEETCYTIKKYF